MWGYENERKVAFWEDKGSKECQKKIDFQKSFGVINSHQLC